MKSTESKTEELSEACAALEAQNYDERSKLTSEARSRVRI